MRFARSAFSVASVALLVSSVPAVRNLPSLLLAGFRSRPISRMVAAVRTARTRSLILMHVSPIAAAAAILAMSFGFATARVLTVVTRGGVMQEATKELFAKPFAAATAIPVQEEAWEGGIDALRNQAKASDNVWDLVLLDSDELAAGCSD